MKRTDYSQVVRESLSEPYNRSLDEAFEVLDYEPCKRRRHLTRAVLALLTTLMAGCRATLPAGELQLGPKIASDMKSQNQAGAQSLSRGRPVYLETYAYPQMLESGDIWAGGQVLVYLGREELSLDQVVGDLGQKNDIKTVETKSEEKSAAAKKPKAPKRSQQKKTALVK